MKRALEDKALDGSSVMRLDRHDKPLKKFCLDLQGDDQYQQSDGEWSRLCPQCAMINFEEVFGLTSDEVGPFGKKISPLRQQRHSLDETCDLCSMIKSILSIKLTDQDTSQLERECSFHLRACDSLRVLRQKRTKSARSSKPDIVITVISGKAVHREPRRLLDQATMRGLIVQKCESESTVIGQHQSLIYRGRFVGAQVVNFPLLCEWLNNCRNSHYECVKENKDVKRRSFKFYVIDCSLRKLTLLLNGMEYLALSYVWGSPTDNAATDTYDGSDVDPAALHYPLPKTIEDAITVVLAMRMRYLWVDRYCIPSSTDKHLQIENMHLIYQGAVATIVALSCDAKSGLYGLSGRRRAQPRVSLKESTLLATFPHLSYHLSNAKWTTRGWTYQEAILSRRCFFFTEDQVYFACRSSIRCETVVQCLPNHPVGGEALSASIMKIEAQKNRRLFELHKSALSEDISEYTSRSLTYESDALNAFRGILSASGFPSFWGIPAEWDYSQWYGSRFAIALLWTKATGLSTPHRRSGFPSWSWTSLAGQINFMSDTSRFLRSPANIHFSEISVKDAHGGLIGIGRSLEMAKTTGLFIPETSPYLYITGKVIKVRICRSKEPSGWIATSGELSQTLPSPEFGSLHVGNVFIDAIGSDALLRRIEYEVWDALKVAWHSQDHNKYNKSYWLLLDWKGTVARRFGLLVCQRFSVGSELDQEAEDRTIVLG